MNKDPVLHHRPMTAVVVASLLALAALIAPQSLAAGDLARVHVSSAGVDFLPEVEYSRAIVTVAVGDEVFRYSFDEGEDPFISVFDAEGEVLADGVYQWELELQPMPRDRSAGAGEKATPRELLSGAFTVVGGFIADPELEEAASVRSTGNLAGLGLSGKEAVMDGAESADRLGDDSDELAVCDARTNVRSASCEAEVQAELASQEAPQESFLADGVVAPNRRGLGDSDAEVAAGGLAAAESIYTPSDAAQGTPAHRTFDPEGANGRPRSEEEQR